MGRGKSSLLERYIAAANSMARVPDALQGGRSRRNVVESRARNALIELAHRLADKGLNWGIAGSLSARVGTHQVLFSRAGVPVAALTFDDLVLARLDQPRPPEVAPEVWNWHTALYRAQAQAQAILHAQPPYATALSTRPGQALPQIPELAAYWAVVAALDPGQDPDTLTRSMAQAAAHTRTVLVPSRGLVCWAPTVPELFSLADTLEAAARLVLLSRLLSF